MRRQSVGVGFPGRSSLADLSEEVMLKQRLEERKEGRREGREEGGEEETMYRERE